MTIRISIGVAVSKIGMVIARFGLTLAGLRSVLDSDGLVYIHAVIDGPFTQSYLEDEWDGPDDYEAYLLVRIEVDGVISDSEWYFETAEEALVWVRHFKSSIEPLVIARGDANV
jgi:hypothetical protein